MQITFRTSSQSLIRWGDTPRRYTLHKLYGLSCRSKGIGRFAWSCRWAWSKCQEQIYWINNIRCELIRNSLVQVWQMRSGHRLVQSGTGWSMVLRVGLGYAERTGAPVIAVSTRDREIEGIWFNKIQSLNFKHQKHINFKAFVWCLKKISFHLLSYELQAHCLCRDCANALPNSRTRALSRTSTRRHWKIFLKGIREKCARNYSNSKKGYKLTKSHFGGACLTRKILKNIGKEYWGDL